jgi:hypothetical protein
MLRAISPKLLRLALNVVDSSFANRFDDQLPRSESLKKQLIRHLPNRLAELVQVRNRPRMMFAGYIRGNGIRSSVLRILDKLVRMSVGVQCDEAD